MALYSKDGHLMDRSPEELAKEAEEAIAAVRGAPVGVSAIIDTLTNILHLANQKGVDVGRVIRTAKMHFDAEKDAKEE